MNFTKEKFQQTFGAGYTESFEVDYGPLKQKLPELIKQHANPNGTALDIGSGSGQWTSQWLVPNFKQVYAIDVVKRRPTLDARVSYIEADSQDFSCTGIADESIDFVFSLGCLCHLSNSANLAYLKGTYRVLKPGGEALLVFANWPNHAGLVNAVEKGKAENREEAIGSMWFYNDAETVAQMAADAGFKPFVDAYPGFRDLVALFTK